MSEAPDAPNPYDVLGVACTATDDELDHAFRMLARRHHPDTRDTDDTDDTDDTEGDPDGRLRDVLAAYALLRHPAARRDYDRRQSTPVRPSAPSQPIPIRVTPAADPAPLRVGPVRWHSDPPTR